MSDEYLSLIPQNDDVVPADTNVQAALDLLVQRGVIAPDGAGWKTAADAKTLILDPNPPKAGDAAAIDVPHVVSTRSYSYRKGHAGMNLEPVACGHCNSELPFDEALAALEAAKDGDRDLTEEERTLICFHCEGPNDVFEADFRTSGAFSRFELRFELSTSRQTDVDEALMQEVAAALGTDLQMVQILQ